ncbi:MAG: hypothetical protein IJ130_13205 [Solobacterium sp.]|nr:hypothetical protein [Solobacterium sp.]
MTKRCEAFAMQDAVQAWKHIQPEIIRRYGDDAYGHALHTWDEGGRMLIRCRRCGGLLLVQKSEFHSYMDDDSYYTDWFPVDNEQDADQLNRMYDGFAIERQFPERFLCMTDLRVHWSK